MKSNAKLAQNSITHYNGTDRRSRTCKNEFVCFRRRGSKDVFVDVDDWFSQSVQSVLRQKSLHAVLLVVGTVQLPRVRHVVTDFTLGGQHQTIRRIHQLSTISDAFDEDL